MKLIVGLGNPGLQYDKTRHNAGFLVVDALAARHASGQIPKSRFNAVTLDAHIGAEKVLLMKPTTYMNLSGKSVGEAVRFFKLEPSEDLIVIVDDIALPVGHTRVRKNGGSGGHNGLSDIDRVLGGARDLRRTGMVWAAEAGATVPQIVAVSGHSIQEGMEILETYLPRNQLLANAAIDKLDMVATPGLGDVAETLRLAL